MKPLGAKLGTIVSMPMAIILLILFFLPMLELQCQGTKLAEANGWQLATGKISASDALKEMNKDNPTNESEKGPEARPWFLIALVLPLIALLAGGLAMVKVRDHKPIGTLLIIIGLVGLVVMILGANVSYADEMTRDAAAKKPADPEAGDLSPGMEAAMAAQMKNVMQTKPTAALWLSLVLYIMVSFCGAANLVLPKLLNRLVPQALATAVQSAQQERQGP